MTSGARDPRAAVRVLVRLARVMERAETDLSLAHYRLLTLVEAEGSRSSSLAAGLSLTKPTVSVAVDALRGRGLLRRVPDPSDRRAVRLELTDQGRRALEDAEAALIGRVAPLIQGVSDPCRLVALLEEVGEALDVAKARRAEARRTPAKESVER
jgi:DNA-binding MarR family transcriptional regulator